MTAKALPEIRDALVYTDSIHPISRTKHERRDHNHRCRGKNEILPQPSALHRDDTSMGPAGTTPSGVPPIDEATADSRHLPALPKRGVAPSFRTVRRPFFWGRHEMQLCSFG